MTTTEDRAWVPDACTLPTADQPLRRAEFDDLFAAALRRQHRRSATALVWEFDPTAEATARELAERESRCCSFFAFIFRQVDGGLSLTVEVPEAHVDVLDALQRRAAERMRS